MVRYSDNSGPEKSSVDFLALPIDPICSAISDCLLTPRSIDHLGHKQHLHRTSAAFRFRNSVPPSVLALLSNATPTLRYSVPDYKDPQNHCRVLTDLTNPVDLLFRIIRNSLGKTPTSGLANSLNSVPPENPSVATSDFGKSDLSPILRPRIFHSVRLGVFVNCDDPPSAPYLGSYDA